jgi:hypothetical protein
VIHQSWIVPLGTKPLAGVRRSGIANPNPNPASKLEGKVYRIDPPKTE